MYNNFDTLLKFDLRELLDNIMEYVDFIDCTYLDKNDNKIMRYWQSKGVTLKSILLTDLLDWLCCLAFSEGFIAPQEVEFINNYLNQSFSDNDIMDLCKFRINEDYFINVPLSFMLLYENDLVMKKSEIEWDFNSVEILYMLFIVIGVQFIDCDNDISFKELDMLNGYTNDLSKRIHDFDLEYQLSILEMSDGKIDDEYLKNRYSFSQDIIDDYRDELSELENLEEINFTPWKIEPDDTQTNLWKVKEIKTNYSWNLDKNINAYYDFSGEFDNHLADISDIITEENRQKLENTRLTPQQYRSILNKIKLTSDKILFKMFNENYIDFNSLTLFEKILILSKSFVDSDYKSSGKELGLYSLNRIHLDDRVYTSYQIITLIHELSHHLLAEIFEQAVMILLNTDKTDALEMFVDMSFNSSKCFSLLNEYCAHSVEGHFTPYEYQDYGSFIKVLNEFDETNEKDREIVLKSMILGNTFCQDILTIITPFFDNYNLRDEIKEEFKKEFIDSPNPNGLSLKIEDTLNIKYLLDYINLILLTGLDEALENVES